MLEMHDISFAVEGEEGRKQILEGVNLHLEDHKLYVITGPNGGGKSSLAKIIMGIYRPSTGKILFDGQDITGLGITQRARLGIGYAFQQPPRFKGMKVRELLELSSGLSGSEGEIGEILFDVGLCAHDYLDREVDASLSGGELKRIEIATVLSRKLKLAVFDEPEAGIDLWSFQKLTETFQNFYRKHQTTLVIISHQERILNLADEVILLADGRVKEKTSKEKILSDIDRETNCQYKQICGKGAGENVRCPR